MSRNVHLHRPIRRAWALLTLLSPLLVGQSAQAHFLWLSAEREEEGTVVLAFLSEHPAPDLPMFMKFIENAVYSADGRELPAERGEDTFTIRLDGPLPRALDGECDLGLMTKEGTTFRLKYTARAQFGPMPGKSLESGAGLRLLLEDSSRVLVTFDGRPAPGAEVRAMFEDGSEEIRTADEEGAVVCEGVAEGLTALLAKWPDGTPGEHDGNAFEETRHYATLTVLPAEASRSAADSRSDSEPAASPAIAPIPQPINSFGGAVLGDHLYLYSGHTGTTHRYHTGTTNPHFYRIDLRDRTTWEELPCGPALQGVALVAHGDSLYRVGGMAARNEEGEPHDLVSVADVARFDPESGQWTDLPPLPEPRSTHDAAVLGDHLYVVGGWSMTGGDSGGAFFLDDALRLDLSDPSKGWELLPAPPAPRRALAVAAHDGKIYMIGGLTEGGGTVRDVDLFDPETLAWTQGPELPGEPIQGFAPSAFSVAGHLFASGGDGTVYRLSRAGDAWEAASEQAVPRITHRLLPGTDDEVLIVGGNFVGVPVRFVEAIPTSGSSGTSSAVVWSAPLPGSGLKSRAFGVVGNRIVLAGGNRSSDPHAFEAENLSGASYWLLPDGSAAESIAPLPDPRQSGVLVSVQEGRRSVGYLLGGIGDDGEVVRTLGTVHRLEPDGAGWTSLSASIPDSRGMFGAVAHGGDIWIFGGSIFDPGADREMPTEVLRWSPGEESSDFVATGHQIPTPRRSFAGAALDGKYYLVGGLGADQELVESVDVFDFSTGGWGSIPAPDLGRVFADLVAVGGKLYLGGGFEKGSSGHFQPSRSIEVFDPEVGTWQTLMNEAPVRGDGLRMAEIGNRLLLFGTDPSDPGRARLAIVSPGSARPERLRAE